MSRNARETRIAPDLLDDPGFLALSNLARLLYLEMLMLADDEGRLVAVPAILAANARLQDLGVRHIEKLASEIERERLFVFYQAGRSAYAFNPRTFERPGTIRWWGRSCHPLPPADLLEAWPDYRAALARLDGHSRLGFNGEPWINRQDGPRYPELWPGLTPIGPEERDSGGRGGTVRGKAGRGRTERDIGGAGAGARAGASSNSLALVNSVGGGFNGDHHHHEGMA